jgi:hypothetical protein
MGGYEQHSFSTKLHPCSISPRHKAIQHNQHKQNKVYSNNNSACIGLKARKIVGVHFFRLQFLKKKVEKDLPR